MHFAIRIPVVAHEVIAHAAAKARAVQPSNPLYLSAGDD